MKVRPIFRVARDLLIAAGFLWLVFRHVEAGEVWSVFASARLLWVAAAVAAFIGGYACRIERWRILLGQENPRLRWSHCAGPLFACVAANNVLPLRAGDLLRAFRFNRHLGISTATSLTTLMVERLLDLLIVVVLLGAALLAFGMSSSQFIGMGGGVLALAAALLLVALLYPTVFRPLVSGVAGWLTRGAPRIGVRVQFELEKAFSALEHSSRGHVMRRLLLWSTSAWLAEGLVFWFCALSLPAMPHPIAAWLALPLGTLATTIPSAPGFVGTFEYFTVHSMTALANPAASATAYALLVHAVLWLPSTVGGGFWLLAFSRTQDAPVLPT